MIVTLFHNKKIIIETYLDYGTLVTTPDPNISGSTNSHLLGDYYRIRKRKDKSQFSMYHGLKTKIGYRAEIPYVITINTKHGPMMYFPKQYSIALELIHPTSSAELSNIPGRIKNLEAHVTRTPYIINSDGLVEIPDEHRVLQVLNNVLDTGRGIDPSLLKNRPFAGLVVIDPRGIEEVIARGNYSAKGEINLRPKMIVYTEDLDIYVINGMFAIAIPRNDNSNIPKDPIEGKELEELLKRLDLVGVIIHNIMGKKILDYRQLGDKDHVPVYIRDWFKEWKINSSELTGVLSYYPIIQRFGMHSIGYRPSGKERKALRKKKINPLRIHVYPEDLEGVLGEDGRIQMEELYRSLDIGNLARSFNTDYANLILAAAAQIIDRESLPNRIEEPTEMGKITSISTSAVDFLIRKELIPTARPISEPRSRLPPIIMIEGSEEIVQKALQILETHQYDLKIPAVKIWIDTIPEELGVSDVNPFGVYIPEISNAFFVMPNVYLLLNRIDALQETLVKIIKFLNQKYVSKYGDLDRIQNYGRITVSEVARRMKNAIFSRSDHHHAGSDEIHDVVDSDSSDTDADAGGGE